MRMDEEVKFNEHNKEEYPPMHTAEHILNRTMVSMFGCSRSFDNHIERKKSKVHYALEVCPTAEEMKEVEMKVNEVIERDLEVTVETVGRDNIPEGVSLDRLPEDASEMLRLVRVGDYDVCPCLGRHVARTSEIGAFRISSTSFAEGKFRVVFRLG